MDNLTHGLTGALIARTLPANWSGEPASDPALDPDAALTRPGRWLVPAAVIAANLPDFEAVFLWPPPLGDKAAYLMHHRGWSHSLVGIAGETLLFAGLLWLLARRFGTGGRWAGFTFARGLAVAGLGAGSHLFLDWWNSYGVRPFYPWDKSWYYGDLVFIADPWVWLTLGGALVCGTRRFGRAKWGWYGLAAVGTVVVIGACWKEQCPWWVLVGWLTGLLEIGLLRWWGRWRGARWIGWGGAAAYLLFAVWVTDTAPGRVPGPVRAPLIDLHTPLAAMPVPGVLWERDVICRRDFEHRWRHRGDSGVFQEVVWTVPVVSPLSRTFTARGTVISDVVRRDAVAADPLFVRWDGVREVQAWAAFARFPVVHFEDGEAGRTLILGDARYRVRGGPDWSELKVFIPRGDRPLWGEGWDEPFPGTP